MQICEIFGLVWPAQGGMFLAGGMASKLRHWMEKPFFRTAFLEKGRMSPLVAGFPVFLVTDEALGLKGAMLYNRFV